MVVSTVVKSGRKMKFKTPEELQEKIDNYFESLKDYVRDKDGRKVKDPDTGEYLTFQKKVATVTGLAVFLDTTRETLLDYENSLQKTTEYDEDLKERFSDTVKKAKLRIYEDTEQQLYKGKATGAIFSLKNNYGWKDTTNVINEYQQPENPYSKLTEEELRKLAGGK